MLNESIIAFVLIGICVVIHSLGMVLLGIPLVARRRAAAVAGRREGLAPPDSQEQRGGGRAHPGGREAEPLLGHRREELVLVRALLSGRAARRARRLLL